ncbi:hypothetical protein I553_8178 [Mycobacterium xenopi 4042]|uniref:Uncharacterized protein n=1 Tax=Mycobacterium xenopi 4042 TaxID=1299334 RepID=X8DEA8_MYCXE|nr:hypothetical protein I553_8178 [Mycobacterium xenopi 4042]
MKLGRKKDNGATPADAESAVASDVAPPTPAGPGPPHPRDGPRPNATPRVGAARSRPPR